MVSRILVLVALALLFPGIGSAMAEGQSIDIVDPGQRETTTAPPQPAEQVQDKSRHCHDGGYVSLSAGVSGGMFRTSLNDSQSNDRITLRGIGPIIEARIGYAVIENWLVSLDFTEHSENNPQAKNNSHDWEVLEEVDMFIISLGLGLTHYFMPSNTFVSVSLGLGFYNLSNYDASNPAIGSADAVTGFRTVIKVGKEWWLSRNWGVGISGVFLTGLARQSENWSGDTLTEKLYDATLGLSLNMTYN